MKSRQVLKIAALSFCFIVSPVFAGERCISQLVINFVNYTWLKSSLHAAHAAGLIANRQDCLAKVRQSGGLDPRLEFLLKLGDVGKCACETVADEWEAPLPMTHAGKSEPSTGGR